MRRVRAMAAVMLLAAMARTESAAAAGAGEWSAGAQAGARVLAGPGNPDGSSPAATALVGVQIQRGITDSWSGHVSFDVGRRFAPRYRCGCPEGAGEDVTVSGSAGVVYSLDVLRTVPFAELSLAAIDISPPRGSAALGIQGGLGAEYLINRRFAVAAIVRYALLPVTLGGGIGVSQAVSAALRASYLF